MDKLESNAPELEKRQFTIEEMQLEDIETATEIRLQSWLDTYVNDEVGITREWIEQRNADQLSEARVASRRERFLKNKENGTMNAWVVRDKAGKIIGSATPFISDSGVQRVGSLYVDKDWQGKGVANELMQRVIDWCDPNKDIELEVISYNERAKAFYRKWGFEEVPGSEALFDGRMPEVKMIRKGASNEI